MPKLRLITFGCQANELDSERIAGLLSAEGFELTDQEAEADLILLNTCSIRQKAEEKLYSRLGRLALLKDRKPSLQIGVTGCIAEQEGEGIRRRFPFVDLVVGTGQIGQIPSRLGKGGRGESSSAAPLRFSRVKAWVEIMRGCDNFCAYCVVPYLRGREQSRSPEEILEEIEALVASGYQEITLLGHNVNSYGKGLSPPIHFPELLRRIDDRVSASVWVRFVTSHPKDLSPELSRSFKELPSLCEHIHLPAQSGSDRILERMGRGYDREQFLRIADELRRWVPEIAITSDIMVGFPGEREEDFQATLDLLQQVRFDRIFSFKYSPRPRTAALSYPDQVPEEEKEDRLSRLISLQNRICLEKNRSLLGKVLQVRVEERKSRRDPGLVTARTRTNHLVHFADPEAQEGSLREVRIKEASTFHLKGDVIH
ncbi:MAG: tRNA (N6-isopentenyl adenosine(37)-C2)-methylthiotransferase MiaB [candidate division NC10 bacterium]|nr:tRNA (N6-isopentenyl adenosine(37)-C2)-methylthiotransferase MiaB [candidate division NC10 bacterium]